jgi:SAM-dependent methyltransferase
MKSVYMSDIKSFYKILAPYYNDLHQEAFIRSILYLKSCPTSIGSRITPGKALDLGCGTGQLTNFLYENGWNIYGIDSSADMISVLKSKYPFLSASVADIRNFKLEDAYDLIVCFGDTINHLLGECDWLTLFRSVSNRLSDRGLFCFDVITPYDHCEVWPNSVTVAERESFTHIARGCTDAEGRPLLINTCFVKEGDLWQRYDSRLLQKSYPLETVLQWLADADLANIIVLDGDSLGKVTSRSTRWLIYAFK